MNMWTGILDIGTYIFEFIMSLLPNIDPLVNATIVGKVTPFYNTLDSVSFILPIGYMASVLVVIFSIESAMFVLKTYFWILHISSVSKVNLKMID